MKEIKVLEGKVVAPEGMKVGIVASRFNEIIVNKLLGGAVDGLVRHGVEAVSYTHLDVYKRQLRTVTWNRRYRWTYGLQHRMEILQLDKPDTGYDLSLIHI